ncbi:Protein of unknown function (DUF2637) [Goodfellowiella coeruleoviolacea]|uniref:DUF2637 domain-containing protein n=1 Tax=Goodfellowiella coeruleoviolacea TaxID=334858 RepID=A0AAE3GI95_9PSEU|nr:Protein of unknown function (DUF2637) [Goodfellowiella coeruleoviolacea]
MPSFRKILRVAVLAVLVAAVVASLVNFEHARDVAGRNGEDWRQWLYPLASDGLILSASLVMLVRRLLSLSSGILAWNAFGAGIAASADTNVAHANHQGGDAVVLAERVVVSAWPTLACWSPTRCSCNWSRTSPARRSATPPTPPRPFLPCRHLPPFLARRDSTPPTRNTATVVSVAVVVSGLSWAG